MEIVIVKIIVSLYFNLNFIKIKVCLKKSALQTIFHRVK